MPMDMPKSMPMPHGNENHRNLSHHHMKEAENFAAHVDSSAGSHMPEEGLCSMAPVNADPHGAGPRMPVHATPSAARPKGEPAGQSKPYNLGPHDALHHAPHELAKGRR
jgi:hypothetical protein